MTYWIRLHINIFGLHAPYAHRTCHYSDRPTSLCHHSIPAFNVTLLHDSKGLSSTLVTRATIVFVLVHCVTTLSPYSAFWGKVTHNFVQLHLYF